MKIVLLGPPGSGKGTLAKTLSNRFSIPIISTGDILREAVREETELGHLVKDYVQRGLLVPDKKIYIILKDRLLHPDSADGFILDGVPRTIPQADALAELDVRPDRVLLLEIEDEAIVKRLSGRRICGNCGATYHIDNSPPKKEGICDVCGSPLITRHDDEEETIRERLRIYHEQTEPLKEYYRKIGNIRIINGDTTPEEAALEALRALET